MRKETACHALVLICLGCFIARTAFTTSVYAAVSNPHAVATFECLGIYCKVENDLGECALRYRKTGGEEWKDVIPLWFDKRDSEYRGSIVGLSPVVSSHHEGPMALSLHQKIPSSPSAGRP